MLKKTYGAPGYMDWVAQIAVGESKVKVHFTGGALTQYGVTDAEYTTANAFFQGVIEGSQYYKDGRIRLIRSVDIGGEPAVKAAAKAAVKEEGLSAAAAEPEAGEKEETVVKVACLQDAQEYLREHYGIVMNKTRTWEMAKACGAQHGVTFELA